MKPKITLKHEFVEFIPEELKDHTLYVSMPYATAIHNCCCGCGNKVVTPLNPTDWKLFFNGETVSLYPSIGNWGFECQSHYWIRKNKVIWSWKWSQERIDSARRYDRLKKDIFFKNKKTN